MKQENKKRILFVSIAFPPKKDSEGIQVAKYFRALVEKGHNFSFDVVTSSLPTLNMPYEPEFEEFDSGYEQKITVNIPESKYVNFLLRKIYPAAVNKPDSKFFFSAQWRSVVRKLKKIPDLIYSRSYPLSSALMAYKLASHYQVPWILHLSDPWTLSPVHHYGGRVAEWHDKWERQCFEKADVVCFTSETTIRLYEEKYPLLLHKFKMSPNVYDEDNISTEEIELGKKLRIVYTGGMVGERSLKWLLSALCLLNGRIDNLSDKLEIIVAGEMDSYNRNLLKQYEMDYINYLGPVSFKDSIKLQRSAHILLLIDSPLLEGKKSMFFPSKLLDYMVAGRRTMAVTPASSTSETIVDQLGGDVFQHNEDERIADYLTMCLAKHESSDINFFIRRDVLQQYDSHYQAKQLLCMMEEVLSN